MFGELYDQDAGKKPTPEPSIRPVRSMKMRQMVVLFVLIFFILGCAIFGAYG